MTRGYSLEPSPGSIIIKPRNCSGACRPRVTRRLVSSSLSYPAHRRPLPFALLLLHATRFIHGSKDTRQDAERDSTRMRVRSDSVSASLHSRDSLRVSSCFILNDAISGSKISRILCIFWGLVEGSNFSICSLLLMQNKVKNKMFYFDL